MKKISQETLDKMMLSHEAWLRDENNALGIRQGKRANFEGLDLSRLDLSNKVLDRAIFAGTILEYTNFNNTRLKSAVFAKAQLARANLSNAVLEKADMRHALLPDSILDGANLQHANLNSAILTNANLKNVSLQNADLQNAHLQNARIRKTNLQNANLQNASLQNARIQRTHLQDTNLLGANLQNTVLAHLFEPSTVSIPYPLHSAERHAASQRSHAAPALQQTIIPSEVRQPREGDERLELELLVGEMSPTVARQLLQQIEQRAMQAGLGSGSEATIAMLETMHGWSPQTARDAFSRLSELKLTGDGVFIEAISANMDEAREMYQYFESQYLSKAGSAEQQRNVQPTIVSTSGVTVGQAQRVRGSSTRKSVQLSR